MITAVRVFQQHDFYHAAFLNRIVFRDFNLYYLYYLIFYIPCNSTFFCDTVSIFNFTSFRR